jgi:hypothetical protein
MSEALVCARGESGPTAPRGGGPTYTRGGSASDQSVGQRSKDRRPPLRGHGQPHHTQQLTNLTTHRRRRRPEKAVTRAAPHPDKGKTQFS